MLVCQMTLPAKSTQARSPLLKYAKTCSPSVTHEGLLPEAFLFLPGRSEPITTRHCSLPSRLKASRAFFPSAPLVKKMCLPQTTGVDEPLPGNSTFHATFLVALHSVG